MAILNKEEFMSRLQQRIGDDTSDEAMTFIEDMTDTFNDMESRSNSDSNAEWEQKYNDLDKEWREKYKARFFESGTSADDIKDVQKENIINEGEEKTYEDLFEEREG